MPTARIPRNKNADGSLIVHKLIGFEVVDTYGTERDDLLMLVCLYAETEEDFQNRNFSVKQFVFPRHNAHLLAKGILDIAEKSEKEGPWPIDPTKKH